MKNEIIHTLNCCIGSIQLKLSSFGIEKLVVEKIYNMKDSNAEKPGITRNKKLILLANNCFELINLACPKCSSKTVINTRISH
jgi:hypothetical protein